MLLQLIIHIGFAWWVSSISGFLEIWNSYDQPLVCFGGLTRFPEAWWVYFAQFTFHTIGFIMETPNRDISLVGIPAVIAFVFLNPSIFSGLLAITLLTTDMLRYRDAMNVHHRITLLLLVTSLVAGFMSSGLLIMFLMDSSDIFMYAVRIQRSIDERFKHANKNSESKSAAPIAQNAECTAKNAECIAKSAKCTAKNAEPIAKSAESTEQIVLAILTACSWAYLRIYKLAEFITRIGYLWFFQPASEQDLFILICLALLSGLLAINVFWECKLLRKFFAALHQ